MGNPIIITFIFLFACIGCADNVEPDKPSTKCCKPIFSIWFHPVHTGDVKIAETNDNITVSVGDVERTLSSRLEYNSLKAFILTSTEWRENAEVEYYSGPWSGPPRDILIIDYKGSGLMFQGQSVPVEWKRRILNLSLKHK